MLKIIAKYMSKVQLKFLSSGIFYSKLSYCLPVFGNIFGLDTYNQENMKFFSFTVKDNNNNKFNKLNRLLFIADNNTQTSPPDRISLHTSDGSIPHICKPKRV